MKYLIAAAQSKRQARSIVVHPPVVLTEIKKFAPARPLVLSPSPAQGRSSCHRSSPSQHNVFFYSVRSELGMRGKVALPRFLRPDLT